MSEIIRYRFVLERLFFRDLKSIIGYGVGDYIAHFLKPFFLAIIIAFVRSKVSKVDIISAYVTVYYGILVWWLFADTVKASIGIFRKNRSIITKIYLPKIILVTSSFWARVAAISLQAMAGVFFLPIVRPEFMTLAIASIFTVLCTILCFNLCIGISYLALRFRAIRTITEFLLFSLFFTMPVTFDTYVLGQNQTLYYAINPIGAAIDIVKNALLGRPQDNFIAALSITSWCALSFLIVPFFQKNIDRTVETI
ncbi:MAG: hypothetical protein ORN52_05940 [Beijerinckiaceae bacterium]|nr:hypothetical protein [Beijerinckiaceae bacterium]